MKVKSKNPTPRMSQMLLLTIMCTVIRMKSYEILLKSTMNSQRFWNLYTTFGVDTQFFEVGDPLNPIICIYSSL